MERIDLNKKFPARVVLNEETWQLAHSFVLCKWKERAAENNLPEPSDLSMSCKFSSLFVQRIFGGYLTGNHFHIFNDIEGKIHDLNESAMDVLILDDPHDEDIEAVDHPDYRESLETCLPRVNAWTKEFLALAKKKDWIIKTEPSSSPSFF